MTIYGVQPEQVEAWLEAQGWALRTDAKGHPYWRVHEGNGAAFIRPEWDLDRQIAVLCSLYEPEPAQVVEQWRETPVPPPMPRRHA